ncbi:hypothetical protein GH714_018835 [Hevea brasiliensis]|uniref:phosphatidate cytidylyltransferase n=1 Tax=Hevea brasiliensis TaxID=3981 RepID=A0A6A6LQ09_HEVBR|nr:hypothetical protein GH714_018835 [Hevea brasiliensis]
MASIVEIERLVLNGSKATWSISAIRHLVTAVARAEPDRLGQEDVKEEVDKGHKLPEEQESVSEPQQKGSQLRKRIVFGLGIGISVGGVVLAGEWVFTVALAAAMFVGARIGASWPVLFGGQAHWTVGLVASLIAISSIIAADTYAFMGGKVFGLLK